MNLIDKDIKDFITIDTLNNTSLLAVSVVDISTYEVLYANEAKKNIMADVRAKNCWEAQYGQESPCMWCKVPQLKQNHDKLLIDKQALKQKENEGAFITYEHFNEIANKWYSIQSKIEKLDNGSDVLISFALDISMQKEVQSELIQTHVQLRQQTQNLENAKKELQELANSDPLTSLYNRRYLMSIGNNIMHLAMRDKTQFCLVMIDIDNFKTVNDTFGHSCGDEVIKRVASKLIELTRQSDIVSRYGGEEFALVFPETNIDGAQIISEKIRECIENEVVICEEKSLKFTISIGVSEFDFKKDKSIEGVLNRSDEALYQAKRSGRNRVCCI